jgi:hypothetical protein
MVTMQLKKKKNERKEETRSTAVWEFGNGHLSEQLFCDSSI